jgi:hypothetical protein
LAELSAAAATKRRGRLATQIGEASGGGRSGARAQRPVACVAASAQRRGHAAALARSCGAFIAAAVMRAGAVRVRGVPRRTCKR